MTETPVFVVTGPSGAGKGTLVRALLDRFPELELAVSATTRERRQAERDGREYWFLSREEFERRAATGEFLEHVEFAGHRYGTLRSELDRI
ncbi:MAG: guanylate kinase, partial [Actinomycetota bacterium]|nr:guanylate kinase [Actinomycetota bacterium]